MAPARLAVTGAVGHRAGRIAVAGRAAVGIAGCQVGIVRLADIAAVALHVGLAGTLAISRVARLAGQTTGSTTSALHAHVGAVERLGGVVVVT